MFLANKQANKDMRDYLRVDSLCKTLASKFKSNVLEQPCYVVTITNKIKTYLSSDDEAKLLRKSNA
jgi:hypothetical protein